MGYQSSFELLSTAVNSLAQWTSSTRDLLSGCFQCREKPEGCISRKRTQAWFDSEQLQREHPFCYVNPVNVTDDKEIISSPPRPLYPAEEDDPPNSPTNISTSLERSEIHNSYASPLTVNSPLGGIASKIFDEFTPSSKFGQSEATGQKESSFASQLEKDYFFKRDDLLRSGGSFHTRSRSPYEAGKTPLKVKSPLMHRKSWFENSKQLDQVDWAALADDDEEDIVDISFGEIWGTTELEDLFGTFNNSSFASFGSIQPVLSTPHTNKYRAERDKYEDIFPRMNSYSNKPKAVVGETSSSLWNARQNLDLSTVAHNKNSRVIAKQIFQKSFIENEIFLHELIQFMKASIFANNYEDVCNFPYMRYNNFSICDISSKSFNRKLVYDLVKEIVEECAALYSYSYLICDISPIHAIQYKVINVLKFSNETHPGHESISNRVQSVREKILSINDMKNTKVPDKLLVRKVTSSEIAKEDRDWNNFNQEEMETKIELVNSIYKDLIQSESSFINLLFKQKCMKL